MDYADVESKFSQVKSLQTAKKAIKKFSQKSSSIKQKISLDQPKKNRREVKALKTTIHRTQPQANRSSQVAWERGCVSPPVRFGSFLPGINQPKQNKPDYSYTKPQTFKSLPYEINNLPYYLDDDNNSTSINHANDVTINQFIEE